MWGFMFTFSNLVFEARRKNEKNMSLGQKL